jgi:nitrogen regulatory protein P-II 1
LEEKEANKLRWRITLLDDSLYEPFMAGLPAMSPDRLLRQTIQLDLTAIECHHYRAEVTGLTVTRVLGHGGETDRVETYRGTTVKMELQEKVRLEIGVSDPFVDVTVKAILGSARTGEVGDGKVFVLDLEQAHRIRTSERDERAVTPALTGV